MSSLPTLEVLIRTFDDETRQEAESLSKRYELEVNQRLEKSERFAQHFPSVPVLQRQNAEPLVLKKMVEEVAVNWRGFAEESTTSELLSEGNRILTALTAFRRFVMEDGRSSLNVSLRDDLDGQLTVAMETVLEKLEDALAKEGVGSLAFVEDEGWVLPQLQR